MTENTEKNEMTEGDRLAKHLAKGFNNAAVDMSCALGQSLVTIVAGVATANPIITLATAAVAIALTYRAVRNFSIGLEMPLEEEKPVIPAAKPKTPEAM